MSASTNGSKLAGLRDISAFVRDALLIALVSACVIQPSLIRWFILESGITRAAFGDLELVFDSQLESATREALSVATSAGFSETDKAPPPVEALRQADPGLTSAVAKISRVAPDVLPEAGWVFLGRIDSSKRKWEDGGSSTTTAEWPLAKGATIIVTDDVYVRKLTDDKWHSLAPVASVARVGDRLTVLEVQLNAAKIGGYYVWVKAAI